MTRADLVRPQVRPFTRPRRRCIAFDFEDEDDDEFEYDSSSVVLKSELKRAARNPKRVTRDT